MRKLVLVTLAVAFATPAFSYEKAPVKKVVVDPVQRVVACMEKMFIQQGDQKLHLRNGVDFRVVRKDPRDPPIINLQRHLEPTFAGPARTCL